MSKDRDTKDQHLGFGGARHAQEPALDHTPEVDHTEVEHEVVMSNLLDLQARLRTDPGPPAIGPTTEESGGPIRMLERNGTAEIATDRVRVYVGDLGVSIGPGGAADQGAAGREPHPGADVVILPERANASSLAAAAADTEARLTTLLERLDMLESGLGDVVARVESDAEQRVVTIEAFAAELASFHSALRRTLDDRLRELESLVIKRLDES
jgi:hypothetical protein